MHVLNVKWLEEGLKVLSSKERKNNKLSYNMPITSHSLYLQKKMLYITRCKPWKFLGRHQI